MTDAARSPDQLESPAWFYRVIWRPNAPALAVMVLVTVAIVAVLWIYRLPASLGIYADSEMAIGPAGLVFSFWGACVVSLLKNRPERPTAFLVQRITRDWRLIWRLCRGLPVLLVMPVVFSAFTSYKAAYDRIVPFYADPYLAALDRLLHGTDPWRLLQPILGHAWVIVGLNQAYNFWFGEMFIALSLAVFVVDWDQLRSQYLIAFFASWGLIGSLAATLLSSAGPCFYANFFHPDPYAGLMSHLDQMRQSYYIPARSLQEGLLRALQQGGVGVGEGISAMPSMHVAIAVLNAIFLSRLNRYLGWAAWTFAALIFIGSVALGWHYAVDGYVAALLVWLIWVTSGRLASRFHPA
jgi:hypothetical protein